MTALEAQLRAAPPAGVAKLEAAHLEHLAGSIRAARRRQGEELEAAGDQALRHVPKLLRGPIRKIVGSM